jgi:hypothetical protein
VKGVWHLKISDRACRTSWQIVLSNYNDTIIWLIKGFYKDFPSESCGTIERENESNDGLGDGKKGKRSRRRRVRVAT